MYNHVAVHARYSITIPTADHAQFDAADDEVDESVWLDPVSGGLAFRLTAVPGLLHASYDFRDTDGCIFIDVSPGFECDGPWWEIVYQIIDEYVAVQRKVGSG